MTRTVVAAIAAVFLFPSAQSLAAETKPWDVTPTSPASGGTYRAVAAPISFEFTSSIKGMRTMAIEVSTQNVPGQDGTLANDFQVDFFLPFESDAYPGTYRAVSHGGPANWWTNVPGTYFWQVTGTCYTGCSATTTTLIDNNPNYPVTNLDSYRSPVFTYTVGTPPPQPVVPAVPLPSPTQTPAARRYVLYLDVAARRAKAYAVKHNHAKKPTARCRKVSSGNAVCTVKWKSRGKRRSLSVDVIYDESGYWVQPR
jgi:hypothetical protein